MNEAIRLLNFEIDRLKGENAELKAAVERYVLRPASFTADGTCSITVPFPEWHRLDRLCGNKSRPIEEGGGS